ncbi:MAG: TlpA family protein disulfide reductase [Spirochaetales bacterium]|nr:TlpA family protein disulfide reductase [Spirochaetales bacterium]
MAKITGILLFTLLLLGACSKPVLLSLEEQAAALEAMEYQAQAIKASMNDKTAENFLAAYDEYYDIKISKVEKAMEYLEKAVKSNLSRNELIHLVKIAETAQDEKQLLDILKELFTRFPDSKLDRRLLKIYFPNAYLLEPEIVEKYVDLKVFVPVEQLECYYALALGFAEKGEAQQAEAYLSKALDLYNELAAQGPQRNTLHHVRDAGLKSFIEYKLGNVDTARDILSQTKKKFTDEYSQVQIALFEKRLEIMGNEARPIEYQFWINSDNPMDFSALKGKVVLIHFFTWNCDACNTALPLIKGLEKQIKRDDFVILGATQYTGDKSFTELREYSYLKDHYLKKRGITWPVCLTRNDGMDDYGISSYPVYILIDKQGNVVDGYYISNFAYLQNRIIGLLEK